MEIPTYPSYPSKTEKKDNSSLFRKLQNNFLAGAAVGTLITIGAILLFELIDEPAFILLIGVFLGFGVFEGIERYRSR